MFQIRGYKLSKGGPITTTREALRSIHRRSLANNIGGGSTMDIRNCNLQGTKVGKAEKSGFNQSLIYIRPLPTLSAQIFYWFLFNSETKTK